MRMCLTAGLLLATMSGCCLFEADRREELEKVAKDWCLTIRASQVIPVYPLTEDLRPGDVYLVTRAVDQDRGVFEERGFLPLDLNVARLDVAKELKDSSVYQHPIGRSLDGSAWPPSSSVFEIMSRAGFPTYRVSVDRQAGLDLALPIQAVPVSLSAMKADKGTATVSLSEAYTYGLDVQSLQSAVQRWMQQDATMNMLAGAVASQPVDSEPWIRVVTRVFLVKSVSVDVATDSASSLNLGAGADAPASKTIDLDRSVQSRALDAVAASPSIPGAPAGRLQLVSATSRSVTMKETFPRPIVIGYLAYQTRLNRDGTAGSALAPTFELLTEGIELAEFADDVNTATIRSWLKGSKEHLALVRDHIDRTVPGKPNVTVVLHGSAYAWNRQRIVDELVNVEEPKK